MPASASRMHRAVRVVTGTLVGINAPNLSCVELTVRKGVIAAGAVARGEPGNCSVFLVALDHQSLQFGVHVVPPCNCVDLTRILEVLIIQTSR